MGILLGLIGGALFGFTYLTWVELGALSPVWQDLLQGEETSFSGRSEDMTGLWVGFLGIGIAIIGGTLRQGTLAAFGGLIGAGLSAVAGILGIVSMNRISTESSNILQYFGSETAGVPQYEVGIGLWLTLGASVLGIVVGVLAYTTRNRINPPSAPGISASDSGTSPAPGLY